MHYFCLFSDVHQDEGRVWCRGHSGTGVNVRGHAYQMGSERESGGILECSTDVVMICHPVLECGADEMIFLEYKTDVMILSPFLECRTDVMI